MKNKNILLLGLIGVAIYWYYKKQKTTADLYPTAPNPAPSNPAAPSNDLGLPSQVNLLTGQAIEQTLDIQGNPVATAYNVRYAIKGIPNII